MLDGAPAAEVPTAGTGRRGSSAHLPPPLPPPPTLLQTRSRTATSDPSVTITTTTLQIIAYQRKQVGGLRAGLQGPAGAAAVHHLCAATQGKRRRRRPIPIHLRPPPPHPPPTPCDARSTSASGWRCTL